MRRLVAPASAVLIYGCAQVVGIDGWEPQGGDASTSTATSTSVSPAGSSSSSQGAGGTGGGAGGGGSTGGQGGQAGCGDTQGNPESCGACGQSCLGGACEDGLCKPLVLVEGQANEIFGHMALGPAHAYWTRTVLGEPTPPQKGDILRVEKQARTLTQSELVIGNIEADMLAAEVSHVYWSSFTKHEIGSFELATATPTILASAATAPLNEPLVNPLGITLVGGEIYWIQYQDPGPVKSIPKTGAPAPTYLTAGLAYGVGLAIDGPGEVYYSYHGTSVANGGVADQVFNPVAEGQQKPSGIALSATHVYWLSSDGSLQRRVRNPQAGAPVETISGPQPPGQGPGGTFVGEVVVDATHVYWTGPGRNSCEDGPPCPCDPVCGAVFRASLDAARPADEVFAQGEWTDLGGLRVDDQAVYWTTGSPTRLLRQAKQAFVP